MPSATSSTPLTFDAFWRWLQDHRNCIIRATTNTSAIFDHDSLHWDFFDEDDGGAICQAIVGKSLVAEFIIERAEVLFVQASPDAEDPQRNAWLFECLGGTKDDSFPLHTFLMSHGMEGTQGHQLLKH